MLGDLDARDIGARGTMRAANLQRRIHLEIEHVLMRRRADQVNHDHGLVRLANAGELLGLNQLGKGKTAEGQAANLQEVPSRHPVA